MDDLRYEIYQEGQARIFEDICKRCGECCGSKDGDPCINLAKCMTSGMCYCKVYENRLGLQKTASGKNFNCVPIRDIMEKYLLRPNCAYNRITIGGLYENR